MEECVYTWHNYNLNSLAILISSRFSVNGLVSSWLYSVFNAWSAAWCLNCLDCFLLPRQGTFNSILKFPGLGLVEFGRFRSVRFTVPFVSGSFRSVCFLFRLLRAWPAPFIILRKWTEEAKQSNVDWSINGFNRLLTVRIGLLTIQIVHSC